MNSEGKKFYFPMMSHMKEHNDIFLPETQDDSWISFVCHILVYLDMSTSKTSTSSKSHLLHNTVMSVTVAGMVAFQRVQ